ncbi:MAG: hypothetical protein QG602_2479 [Verrucomicrobiota bacterium]|nr:hypothetical protein [Verrucomicrobiota bacterium]
MTATDRAYTAMAFTDIEFAEHTALIEKHFWSKHRPSLQIRDRMREGQRIDGQSIELFLVRPLHFDPTRHSEEAIAKLTFVRSSSTWRIFWQRADLKWHRYAPHPEAASLAEALRVVDQDANACFFG